MTDAQTPTALHAELYEWRADEDRMCLWVAACPQCARINFPATVPGCAHCGAALQGVRPSPYEGTPRLRCAVRMHQPLAPGVQAPCTIATVELADKLSVQAVLSVDHDELEPGIALRPRPLWLDEGRTYRCVFEPVEAVQ